MSGYRDPDEEDYFIRREDSKAVLNVLLAPIVIGGFLLFKGFAGGGYLMAGIGALVLESVPIMIYIGWRRGY